MPAKSPQEYAEETKAWLKGQERYAQLKGYRQIADAFYKARKELEEMENPTRANIDDILHTLSEKGVIKSPKSSISENEFDSVYSMAKKMREAFQAELERQQGKRPRREVRIDALDGFIKNVSLQMTTYEVDDDRTGKEVRLKKGLVGLLRNLGNARDVGIMKSEFSGRRQRGLHVKGSPTIRGMIKTWKKSLDEFDISAQQKNQNSSMRSRR